MLGTKCSAATNLATGTGTCIATGAKACGAAACPTWQIWQCCSLAACPCQCASACVVSALNVRTSATASTRLVIFSMPNSTHPRHMILLLAPLEQQVSHFLCVDTATFKIHAETGRLTGNSDVIHLEVYVAAPHFVQGELEATDPQRSPDRGAETTFPSCCFPAGGDFRSAV